MGRTSAWQSSYRIAELSEAATEHSDAGIRLTCGLKFACHAMAPGCRHRKAFDNGINLGSHDDGNDPSDSPLHQLAVDHDAPRSQLALAWLLKRSPVMPPIPGTSRVSHLKRNVAAAGIHLGDQEFDAISAAVG